MRAFCLAALRIALPCLILTTCFAEVTDENNRYERPNGTWVGNRHDGPAELPRRGFYTPVSATPSPGATLIVDGTTSLGHYATLDAAYTAANCGDTIKIDPAFVADEGHYITMSKRCDAAHWLTIRTSASDTALPPESTRLTPCFAGYSHATDLAAPLPGMPTYPCANPVRLIPQIVKTKYITNPCPVPQGCTGEDGPIVVAGATYHRLIGLEIMPDGTPGGVVLNLVDIGETTSHIIFDRIWIHGDAVQDTRVGVSFAGNYIALIDSYINDVHCQVNAAGCTEGKAIAGGNVRTATGTWKLVNNLISGGSENLIFGGANCSTGCPYDPSDIEIRRNHFYKPHVWRSGDPNQVFGNWAHCGPSHDQPCPFNVKNIFELKVGVRVLVEGNVLDHAWRCGIGATCNAQGDQMGCPSDTEYINWGISTARAEASGWDFVK